MENRVKEILGMKGIAFPVNNPDSEGWFSHKNYRVGFKLDNVADEADEILKPAKCIINHIDTKKIVIKNIRSDKVKLLDEINVFLEENDEMVTAISYDFGQYGQGVSEEDAIQDLCEVLIDYYFLLSSENKKIGKNLKAHLAYFKTIFKEL